MMSFREELTYRPALATGWIKCDSIECTLSSGRKFRYQMNDYPFRIDATELEIDKLVTRIIMDKYRYCQWDRDHPQTNQEVEIFDAMKTWMLNHVANAQKFRA